MTYPELEDLLRTNGYGRFTRETFRNKTSCLEIYVAPIMMDTEKEKLKRILFGYPVQITRYPNQAVLELRIMDGHKQDVPNGDRIL